MPNTYIDVFDFLRGTTGLETASLVGNTSHFTVAQTAGASALTVAARTVTTTLLPFDRITIFDGSQTEVVTVGTKTTSEATSIPLLTGTTLAYNHAIGVAWCSDGPSGSLADAIVDASAWMEKLCYQPLLQATYTDETIDMPGMRASVNNRGSLTFRPWHFPVTTIAALSIATADSSQAMHYDVSNAFIAGNKRLCSIRDLRLLNNQQITVTNVNSSWAVPDRNAEAALYLTYTAGYQYASLPPDIKEVAILVASDIIGKRHNPIGAAQVNSGGINVTTYLRGDLTGESGLIKRAMQILSKYSVELY